MQELELNILWPALLAGVLVLLTHIPLGMRVLAHGVIFADLAVAQMAGLGIVIAELLGFTGQAWQVQLVAVISALAGAVILSAIETYLAEVKEACIGLVFVLAACAGILLLSHDVHAGEHLQELLVGQVLWVTSTQLIYTAILSVVLGLVWYVLRERLGNLGFYALFACAVTASVQLVGVYLVFASLIIPALASYKFQQKRLLVALLVGLGGYIVGLPLSAVFDLPSGAAVVWSMALCGISCALLYKLLAKKS